jgi:hypothetical protein
MSKKLAPEYLNSTVAILAVHNVVEMVKGRNFVRLLKRKAFHVVILVPSMKDERDEHYPAWPNYAIEPVLLYEQSVGKDTADWQGPYDAVAQCKALQLWHDRNDGRTNIIPHLLFPGDVPHWGGVKREGIVVSCAGVQSWLDRMISGMIADACIGLAYENYMAVKEKRTTIITELDKVPEWHKLNVAANQTKGVAP